MLTTVERLKKLLSPQEDESEDDLLLMQIAASSQTIENYCKRSFRKQTYTERLSGFRRSKYINLRNYPVELIKSMEAAGDPVIGYEILEDGQVYHAKGWPSGEHNLLVTYTGGYVLPGDATPEKPRTLPEALELACLYHAQLMLRTPGVTSERVGDISVNYSGDSEGLPATVVSLISPYVGRWV